MPPTSSLPITFSPSPTGLPGSAILQSLTNGLGFWALIIALAAMVLGAVVWAIANHSQNYQQAFNGRRAVLISGLASLIIGAAPTLIKWFYGLGTTAR